jgi:hypothetical protein
MIQIIREQDSAQADTIEAEFRELVISYGRVIVTPPGAGRTLPAIQDGARLVSGDREIAAYLNELRQFVSDWRMFEGDFCYVDDDGSVC